MIGDTLGRYQILEKVGCGGVGIVYRARDPRLERDVAIKVLSEDRPIDAARRESFRREALSLSWLNHPNIQILHDFECEAGVDFLVSEYIPGVTLKQRLGTGSISEKATIRLSLQLTDGLASAHEVGLIHCDISPSNLRIMPTGRLKILDFGIARRSVPISKTSDTVTIDTGADVTGTIPYMAPEQLLGKTPDARCDTYAVGAILYEMATGRVPFPGTQVAKLIDAVLNRQPEAPTSINPELSPALEAVILRALAKDPDQRFQTARELNLALALLVRPDRTVAFRPWSWRRRAVLAAAFLCTFMAGILLLQMTGLGPQILAGSDQIQSSLTSLAVLPLEPISLEGEQQQLAAGMTDELIHELGQLDLAVASRTSVLQYLGARRSLPDIARELGVGAVLEGTIQLVAGRVRILVRLVDAVTDRNLWVGRYEHDLSDRLSSQSQIAHNIAQQIQQQLAAG